MAVLLACGGAYALASWDWCRHPPDSAVVVASARGSGPLFAGAYGQLLNPPYPVVAAGYGPPRPRTSSAQLPLKARAVVLQQGDVRFGLVSLDLVLIPEDVAAEIRRRSGLTDVFVVATHTHSSMGAFDHRLVAQLGGAGAFREEARTAVVDAALAALEQSERRLTPVLLEMGAAEADLGRARSGARSDRQITRVRFGSVAQWLLLAAHPTLVSRPAERLHPDYPGALAEAQDAGVTLVLQTAVGNASSNADGVEQMVERAAAAFDAVPLNLAPEPHLAVTRVRFSTPPTDASRLVPRLFAMPGQNFLCASAQTEAELGILEIGPLRWVAVPAEVTYDSAQALGGQVLSLANGYLGYVEPPQTVDRAEGESKRQYYRRELLPALLNALDAGVQHHPAP